MAGLKYNTAHMKHEISRKALPKIVCLRVPVKLFSVNHHLKASSQLNYFLLLKLRYCAQLLSAIHMMLLYLVRPSKVT